MDETQPESQKPDVQEGTLPLQNRPVEPEGPKAIPTEAEPPKPKAAFSAEFGDDGILRIELNLTICIKNEDKRHMMRGFIDDTRDRAMGHIFQTRAAMAENRDKIIRLQNKNGHKNFISKLFS